MNKFKVTMVKIEKIIGPTSGPMQFIEQNYKTDKPGITIEVPPGYTVVSVIQFLPDITQLSYEVEPFNKNEEDKTKWNDFKKRNFKGKHPLSS